MKFFIKPVCVNWLYPYLFIVFFKRGSKDKKIGNLALAFELDPFIGSHREASQYERNLEYKV